LKIFFFIRCLELGGAERQLVNLAVNLKERGHEIFVATMYSGGDLAAILSQADIAIYSLEKKSRWHLIRPFLRLLKLRRSVNPDVLHSYGPEVNVLATMAHFFSSNKALVWGIRNAGLDLRMYGRFERALYRIQCALSKFPDLIIANSNEGRLSGIRDGFSPNRLEVVHNGINTQVFKPNDFERNQTRLRLGIASNKKVVGVVGRIDPQKDHRTFIESISLLPEALLSEIRVACIGYESEDQIRELKIKVVQSGLSKIFLWVPRQKDSYRLINSLDLLVSSSNAEGFSNVLAEALAMGIPCVATDVGDSKQIVSNFGLIVPPQDPPALALGISRALNDHSFQGPAYKVAARAHVVDNFSVDQLGDKTEGLLSQLVGINTL